MKKEKINMEKYELIIDVQRKGELPIRKRIHIETDSLGLYLYRVNECEKNLVMGKVIR